MKILVKWPTRGRWEKWLKVFHEYQTHAADYRVLVSYDADDLPSLATLAIASHSFNTAFCGGEPKGKIAAINRDMQCAGDWDILVLASDDMVPEVRGWDAVIRADMQEHFPDTDGALWYSDGSSATDKICTMVVMGRKYYERFGYIYHPDYKELWCDNEFTDVGVKLKRIKRIDRVLFRHCHPLNQQAPPTAMDDTYRKSEAMFHVDRATYEKRKAANFDLPKRVSLDILMCSLTSRMAGAELMRQHIHDQTRGKDVNVLLEVDDGEMSIGAKRNRLVARSDADYVCFVDDDDEVSDAYVASLLEAIESEPDCVTFNGRIFWQGKWKPWEIKLGHGFSEKDGKFLRPPNHLCPIRHDIVAKHPFPDKNFGEDTAYAQAMMKAGALKTEVHIDKQLYFYEPNLKPRKD